MKRASFLVFAASLILLLAAPTVHADFIHWSYDWQASPGAVHAADAEDGSVVFTPVGLTKAGGSTALIAANLKAFSDASVKDPAQFNHAAYSLTLTIFDTQSDQWGRVTFTGFLSGSLTADTSNIHNTFTGDHTQLLHLGHDLYAVTIDSFTPPGPPGTDGLGSIGAHVKVTHNPEPSSLILAGLGLPFVGLLLWQRRRRNRSAAAVAGPPPAN
jgi:hypothetical protein